MENLETTLGRKLTLGDDEVDETTPADIWKEGLTDYSKALMGKVIAHRSYSQVTLRINLMRMFQPVRGLEVVKLSGEKFLIEFQHELDRKHAIDGAPWVLDKHLLVLEEIPPNCDLNQMEVNWSYFTVQTRNIPWGKCTMEVATYIGNRIGQFIGMLPVRGEYENGLLRIRIKMDITKRLKRGLNISGPNGASTWISFAYEKLPTFCYLCGLIGHVEKKCPTRYEEDFIDLGNVFEYGIWLVAPTGREMSAARNSHTPNISSVHTQHSSLCRGTTDQDCGTGILQVGNHTNQRKIIVEKNPPPVSSDSTLVQGDTVQVMAVDVTDGISTKTPPVERRKICISGQRRKAREGSHLDNNGRPEKRIALDELEINTLPAAEVAQQPRREL